VCQEDRNDVPNSVAEIEFANALAPFELGDKGSRLFLHLAQPFGFSLIVAGHLGNWYNPGNG
jgi:hypothetical protein